MQTTKKWSENVYVPPQPINDEDRKSWFTNFDKDRMDRIRSIKMNEITAKPVTDERTPN